MILIILLGILIGYLICIPVGPIIIYVLNTKIKRGFLPAMAVSIGGGLMDLVYFSLILSGFAQFEFNEKISNLLKAVGILFLFILGLKEFFFSDIADFSTLRGEKVRSTNYLILGMFIYISNPTLIVTISTLCAFLKSLKLFEINLINNLIFSFSVAIGSILWSFTLLKLISLFEGRLTQKLMQRINKGSGLLMISLSIYLGFKSYFF